ncbi:MAG: DUF2254 domain-containing protein [Bacteroidia bacterium]
MNNKIAKWLRINYGKIVTSIAFYPAIIAIGFLILSVITLELDFSETGKHIKSTYKWISLKDASTARSILSTIVGGIISLTVFSFSMVMILLNQAASQMSNRMLEGMITNRFQQVVLGIYIGSIVYALSLLSSIRDIDSGIYVPALSIYLLLLFTVIDIFIFIYFLHYVTDSVKYETIIKRVHKKTLHSLYRICTQKEASVFKLPETEMNAISMASSNYFQGFNETEMAQFASNHDGIIQFLHPPGIYLLKGIPLLNFYSNKKLSEEEIGEMLIPVDFYTGQPIEVNPYYGFHQLAEVAIKALSPGINDPETAVLSINALTDLFSYKLHHFVKTCHEDDRGTIRVQSIEWSFEKLFAECYYPIWNYGKNDRYIQQVMERMMKQLIHRDANGNYAGLFNVLLNDVKRKSAENDF